MTISRRRFLRQAAAAASAAVAVPNLRKGGPTMKSTAGGDRAMEEALEILSPTGPEYDGGLANHGPMAAEALVALERPESVVPWVEGYRRRLQDHPSATRPIDPKAWREALGEGGRVGDWTEFFRVRLAEEPWPAVLGTWCRAFAPGIVAAAFHGVIRTAHAVRSLDRGETPARLRELAEGLGYWAATYEALPESAGRPAPDRLPSQAIARVESLPPSERVRGGIITERLAPLDRFSSFAGVADLVDSSADPDRFLSDLTETFAGVYLSNVPPGSVITYIHTVTGPSAVRLLLPHVDSSTRDRLLRYAWQGAAALYASNGGRMTAPPAAPALPPAEELVDRAIATGDEHAIKFTEACLREHSRNPKTVYLQAALHAAGRLA